MKIAADAGSRGEHFGSAVARKVGIRAFALEAMAPATSPVKSNCVAELGTGHVLVL